MYSFGLLYANERCVSIVTSEKKLGYIEERRKKTNGKRVRERRKEILLQGLRMTNRVVMVDVDVNAFCRPSK